MPGFTMTAKVYTLKKDNLQKVVQAFVEDAMRKGVKAFLRACLPNIPVRTGFLRGAFTEVIRKFDPQQTAFTKNILKAVGKALGKSHKPEYYYFNTKSKIEKTETSGIRFVTPPDKVLTILANGVGKFLLNVRVSYYQINDFYSKIPGSPWYSMRAGQQAMEEYLDKAYSRFPAIEKILTETKIKLDGTRSSSTQTEPDTQFIIHQMKTIS